MLGSQFLTFYTAAASASVSLSARFWKRKPTPNSLILKGVETVFLHISQLRPKERGKKERNKTGGKIVILDYFFFLDFLRKVV